MSNQIKQVSNTLEQYKANLTQDYHIKKIGIFGSFARGDMTKKSDIDILIEFAHPIGLFKFVELEQKLSTILGRRVDLVTKQALKPLIKKEVLQQTIYV